MPAPGLMRLQGAVQHYQWGGRLFVAGLLGVDNSEGRPFAELWIGAHPKAPATADVDGVGVPLHRIVERDPEAILGPAAASRFSGRLPYLFKVLDARKMLSIQAHPNRHQAEAGFARENAASIALHASHRNYRDPNHKPEVHVALTEFWMLHGFRPLEEIAAALREIPEFRPVMPEFGSRLEQARGDVDARRNLLRRLYETVMTMPQGSVDAILDPLIERLTLQKPTDKDSPDFWAARAARDFPLPAGHRYRGIFSVYLLNLVHLWPGEGTFQPAGVLHAYLEGATVELMANSDNVLRGGLTPKHVDAELLRVLSFDSGPPRVLKGEPVSACERVYRTPAEEFELSRVQLVAGQRCILEAAHGPDSLIVIEGSVTAAAGLQTLSLRRGEIVLAPWGTEYSLEAAGLPALLFKASIPST